MTTLQSIDITEIENQLRANAIRMAKFLDDRVIDGFKRMERADAIVKKYHLTAEQECKLWIFLDYIDLDALEESLH